MPEEHKLVVSLGAHNNVWTADFDNLVFVLEIKSAFLAKSRLLHLLQPNFQVPVSNFVPLWGCNALEASYNFYP